MKPAVAPMPYRSSLLGAAWAVYWKELLDALRDRRTLMTVLISSVAMGPLVLVLISNLVAGFEKRAEARTVVVVGIEHAPTLRNFIERQTFTIKAAPDGYEQLLRDSKLGDAVVVVPKDFEADLHAARQPTLEVLGSSGNQRAQGSSGQVMRLLRGFATEQASLRLMTRGVSGSLLEPVRVEDRDLADPATRGGQFSSILPFFVMMAVLYGALNAALDTTAGERERGSLEPLLMNPAARSALVLGKWGAVASVAVLIAVLSCLSFLPGQWLLKSESLSAMFRFGTGEAVAFIAILTPLACALSAVLMALAIRCKSFKEAQASATVVILAMSMMPMVTVFNQDGIKPWFYWVPALGQTTLMGRVLKGEVLPWADLLPGCVVAALLTFAALAYVVRALKTSALR